MNSARLHRAAALAGLSVSAIFAVVSAVLVQSHALAQGPGQFRAFVPYASVSTSRPTPIASATPEICTEKESQDYGQNGTTDRVVTLTFAGHVDPVREEIDEDADGNADSITEHRYTRGGVRTFSKYDDDGDGRFDWSARYGHDPEGRHVWTQITSGSVLRHLNRWRYDEQSRLVRFERDEGADGLLDFIREYRYNKRGFVALVETDDDGDGTIDSVGRYTYDNNDKLIRHEVDDLDDSPLDFAELYDWKDDLLVRSRFDLRADGVIDSITEYTYDGEGRETLTEIDSQADGEFESWWETEYNSLGKVASVVVYRDRAWHDTVTHQYDDSGRLTMSLYHSASYGSWSKHFTYSCTL